MRYVRKSSVRSKSRVRSKTGVKRFALGRIGLLCALTLLGLLAFIPGASAEAPTLVTLSISPASVNVTSESKTVKVTAEVSTTANFSSGSVQFESPTEADKTERVSFTKVSGTATKGVYEANVTFKRFIAPGTWRISSLDLQDAEGSQVRLSYTQLVTKGFTPTVSVESIEDNEPPQLAGLSFSSSKVNVISEAQTVAVTAHITDNLSGFLSGSIEFRSPNGQRVTEAAQFTKLSGTATDGMYEAKVTFKRYIMPGPWKVTALHMVDNVENGITLGSRRIAAKGFPTTIEVESIEDEAPPSLVGLSISPSSVNVMSESKSVNVGAHITDDKSGVASASITFESPNGKQTTARAAFTKVSGTEIDGMWEATVTFEQFIQSGTWKVKSVHLEDNVGNKADLGAVLLEGKGLPTTVQVESNEDTAPPALATLSFAPTPVNVESTNQTMTVTAEITDNLSGFASGSVVFESPSGKVITNVASFLKVSGTATKGIYEAKVAFKRFIQKGTWKVSNVNLVDKVGNEVNLSASQLEGKALPATVNVESIEDTEPPALAGLTITPRTIDTATSNEDVIVIAHITDNLSGFNKGFITFESENGKHQTGQSNLNVKLSGTETDGSWEGVAVFKQTLESGTWKVSSMVLTDNAGNEISYSAAQLEAKGFPATVVDETSAPPTVRKLSPKKGLAGGGTKVTVTGTNFIGVTAVQFGGKEAVGFSVTNPDKLTATSPEGTTGVVDLTVTTPNGTSAITTHDHFKYAAPTVTEVTPNHGPKAGGTEVTITGTGFALGSSGTTFKVGGVMASHVNCVSRSSCTAKTPPGSKLGGVNVIAIVGGKKSASNPGDIFKYT